MEEVKGMRKDVKRSLLLWPAAASVTITVVSWLPTQIQKERLAPLPPQVTDGLQPNSPLPRIHVLASRADAVTDRVEAVARQDHGTRGLRLPDRVAEAFGIAAPKLKAPVRQVDQELAGLVLDAIDASQSERIASTRTSSSSDVWAAEGSMRQTATAVDESRGAAPGSQQPRTANDSTRQSEKLASSFPADPVYPMRGIVRDEAQSVSNLADADNPGLNPPLQQIGSILPRSNRILARPERSPRSDASEDVARPARAPAIEMKTDPASGSGYAASPWRNADSVGEPYQAQQTDLPDVSDRTDRLAPQDASPGEALADNRANPAGWPVTIKLDQQLELLSAMALNDRPARRDRFAAHATHVSPIPAWTAQVSDCLQSLRRLPRLGDQQAGELIDRLRELAAEGTRQAEQLQDRSQQVPWLCTAYAVQRRVAVWQLVWQTTRSDNAWMVGDLAKESTPSLADAVANVRDDLLETGDVEGWNEYLLLNQINSDSSTDLNGDQRRILAQRFLSRLQWHRLTPEQKRWLERPSVRGLADVVRPWAQDAVDYTQLMQEIEVQETDAIDLVSLELAGAVQTLRYADNPIANEIAAAIDTHYRNANLRLAISDQLLNRLLPEIDPRDVPVRSRLLGSDVRGRSRVDSDLAIELVPSADRWKLRLSAHGNVMTHSTGRRDSVTLHTLGHSQFEAGTNIEISKRGLEVDETAVDLNGKTRLRKVETELDGWPLLGPLAKTLAENRYQAIAPQASRLANQTLQRRIRTEIDDTLQSRTERATEQLSELVLGPLSKLQLDPQVTDMQTTDKRLLARFRLAGDWQMAAFTPRPRAPGSSLMSLQVHQSAFNNTIEQLLPRGEATSIEALFDNIAATFGQEQWQVPDDIPDNITIQFSNTRPVTVEIEDNRLWITLRIVRLHRPDSVDLTNFIVRAAYKPTIDGIKANLVREGHLRISGPRMSMRERLPARTIFNKVLSSNRQIPLIVPRLQQHPSLEGLAVSQLELRSGWLAVAISESDAPRIALAP